MIVAWAPIGFLLGAIVGSFLATAAIRWPAGRQASTGRSACDHCGQSLRIFELVPVLSFVASRGACRRCQGAIDRRHLAIELAGAGIGALAFGAAPGAYGVAGAIFGWALLLLAVLDLDHFWLPDRVTLPLALLGVATGAAGLLPFPNDRLIGLAAGYTSLAAIRLLYRHLRGREGLGGGDPKLFGAIGAWLGWTPLPYVLLLAGLTGIAAVLVAKARGHAVGATTRLPFGALLAVAAFPVWLLSTAA